MWDDLFIPILDAVFAGKSIAGVEIDYHHPAQQTEMEENSLEFTKKRVDQLIKNTDAFSQYWVTINKNSY